MSTDGAPPSLPPLPSNPDENAGPRILGATLAVTCLSVLVAGGRFYVRTFMVKALGWDDFFMLFAIVVAIVAEALLVLSVKYGAGQHIGDLLPATYMIGMKFNFLTQGFLQWGVCLVKLSVGFALLRIATQKRWRYPIMGIMAFMVVYTAGCFTTLFTQCEQVAMQWDPSIPRKCYSQKTLQGLAYTHAVLNIFTDFLFAVAIPIPMLWKLQMNKRTKAAVMCVLSLGIFVCLAGILRIPTIVNYGKTGDFLWDSRDLSIWFYAEFNTGIIAGSLPALKPVFKSILDSTYLRSRSQKYAYGASSNPNASQHRPRNSKGFNNLSNRDRDDVYDEYDGTASQKNLVVDSEALELGIIKKNVTTTVTSIASPTDKGPRRHAWDA